MDENTPGRARGISVYDFDSKEGRLTFNAFVTDDKPPSYLVTDRSRSIIYSVCEHPAGEGAAVCAHKVKPPKTGQGGKVRFEPLGKVSLPGSDPCHLAFAGRNLAVSCYSSGHLLILPLAKDGAITEVSQVIEFSSATDRGSHVHCSVYQPSRSRLLVTDLGDDKLKVVELGEDGLFAHVPELDVSFPEFTGPRHIALHPGGRLAVVNGECRGIVHLLDTSERRITALHGASALPERVVDQAHGAALRVAPNGKLVYVSDRNFSVINALRLDHRTEALRFRHSTPTGGEHPRDFQLSPDGRWLLVANLKSSSIGVFQVTPRGELTHYHTFGKVPTPTCLAWL